MIVGIGLLYRFAVKDGPRGWLGVVTPGAVVAMVGWLIVSALFAVYTANFSSYSKTYGALASIVVLLLWLWLSSLLVLIGAEVDGARADERHEFVSALRETSRDSRGEVGLVADRTESLRPFGSSQSSWRPRAVRSRK